MVATIVLVLLLTAIGAGAEDLLHSLDGGASFSVTGSIEGKLNRGDAVVVRTPASDSDLAKLQALAEQDRFYAVRVGPQATASVRATCFAAPPDTIHESLTVAMANGRVVGISYVVSSPSCGVPITLGARVQLPSTTLPVDVLLPAPGPQILADLKGSQGSGPLLTNPAPGAAGAGGAGRQRPGGGPASRPVGSMPTTVLPTDAASGGQAAASEGGEAPAQPPPEQSWLQKNWLFIAGGAMVLFNVLTTASRQAGAPPAGAAGSGGGGGGGERR